MQMKKMNKRLNEEEKVKKTKSCDKDKDNKELSNGVVANFTSSARKSLVRRAFRKLNPKRCCQRTRSLKDDLSAGRASNANSEKNMESAESQISVRTFDLFKYASRREKLSIGLGLVLMWYAASWQPISVFILAIMATLMGQYSKQTSLVLQLNNQTSLEVVDAGSLLNSSAGLILPSPKRPNPLKLFGEFQADESEKNLPILRPFYSLVSPIFDISSQTSGASQDADIRAAVHDILNHESNQFLRKSFEINGSAFLLALTQLFAFFLGMTLITWAAKKQASRLKILYFTSCLHQEVTWFEAIDSAGGAGSSLNALVERYEDGIGIKLALLSYFLGHVALFAITAFYQMFNLAAFCMPFVLAVGLIIAYLSEWQAEAIGDHALFAKRSLQLAEEIIAAIRTVSAFNGQQKELTRFSISLQPVYRKSLVKHLYTALNTSLSKFSIFACFSAYCFYAMRLFPPYDPRGPLNKATVLAVMRGAEVSIVNILISIPFMEALQQSKGSIARIYAAIERRSSIDPSSRRGARPAVSGADEPDSAATTRGKSWRPSISFRMVQFGYADRSGPTKRRTTLPFLNLAGSPGSGQLPLESGGFEKNPQRRRSILENLAEEPVQHHNASECRRNSRSTCSGTRESRRSSRALERTRLGVDSPRTKCILSRFNLDIKAGQSVALVGPSGSGKSTVLALVQRLYDITSGQLLVGKHNIKDLNVSWLRNQIGVVTQEARLFDMSIADNIRLGLNSSALELEQSPESSMQQVLEAAKAANAHEFISRLPNGYETKVGSGGVQLSGGQKQRIAIARALIRRPKILLLDECTSALDTESEQMVQRALKAASEGRTTLTVAHRLDTIKHVDMIVVMNEGQVVESGTHDELMSSSTMYRAMYEEQLKALTRVQLRREPTTGARPVNNSPRTLDASQLLEHNDEVSSVSSSKQSSLYDYEMQYSSSDEEDDDDDNLASSSNVERPSVWQIWQFMEMPKWSALAATLTCLLSGLILPMNLIAHSYLFSAFAYNELDQLGDYLHVFGLIILSFSTLVFIVSFLQVILPGYVGEKLSVRLRVKMMDSLLSKPMFYFDMDSNSAGALCDRFNSYIANIQNIAGTRTATMLEAISTLAAGAFFGFGQNLRLSLFCLSFALLVLLTTIVESRIVQREANLLQKYDARLAHMIADALSNIKTIASLNKETFFIHRFSELIRQRELGTGARMNLLRIFLTSLKFVMPAMSWSASMYYGCHLLVDGRIDLQTIFIVCPVVLFAVNDTFRALVFLPELLKARKSVKRLYRMSNEFSPEVLQTLTLAQQFEQQNKLHVISSAEQSGANLEEKKRKSLVSFAIEESPDGEGAGQTACSEAGAGKINRRMSNLGALPSYMGRRASRLNSLVPRAQARGRIEFRDVEFAYPNRPTALALDSFSLSVAPGESVALVGGSGSGKSTCVSVLEKFYDYHAGSITLDGHDLRLVESNWVRSQIGLVSQEATLLSYTIGDNIRYGANNRFVSMEEVVEAARTANIHDFIMSLPDQYDTELSSSSYSSSQLSGGQRQRIAIARALIGNAPILIFDEATSALDTRNESVVQDALNKARRGRTNITIAHRLATVRDADKIAVVCEGRVVELGPHEQLLQLPDGHYRRLWESQEGVAEENNSNE